MVTPGNILGSAVEVCAIDGCGQSCEEGRPLCEGHRKHLPRNLFAFVMGTWENYLADPLSREVFNDHMFAIKQANRQFNRGGVRA